MVARNGGAFAARYGQALGWAIDSLPDDYALSAAAMLRCPLAAVQGAAANRLRLFNLTSPPALPERARELAHTVELEDNPIPPTLPAEPIPSHLDRLLSGLAMELFGAPLTAELLDILPLLRRLAEVESDDRCATSDSALLRRIAGVFEAWGVVLRCLSTGKSARKDPEEGEYAEATPIDALWAVLPLTPAQVPEGAMCDKLGLPLLPRVEGGVELHPAQSFLDALLAVIFFVFVSEGFHEKGDGTRDYYRALNTGSGDESVARLLQKAPEVWEADCNPSFIYLLAARSYYELLRIAPVAVRRSWSQQVIDRRMRDEIERLTAGVFSPAILQCTVTSTVATFENFHDDAKVITKWARRARQLTALYTKEELATELMLVFPDSYPLRSATVDNQIVSGVPQKRQRNWMLATKHILDSNDGAHVALRTWAMNLTTFFTGVEDCPICYSMIHPATQSIPRKACPTCKYKFHAECIYKWFRTSNKATCPLCQSPF